MGHDPQLCQRPAWGLSNGEDAPKPYLGDMSEGLPMDKITEPAKLKAATTYNAAADHFDDAPPAFCDRFVRKTIERLHLKPESIVLDVGCGSGASAIPAAKAVGTYG